MRSHWQMWGLTAAVVAAAFIGTNLLAAPPAIQVHWTDNLSQAHEVSARTRKPMLIVFTASYCRFCTKLKKQTLEHPEVAEHINRAFVPIMLDVEKNPSAAQILEVESLPCTVVLSPEADLLAKLDGFTTSGKYYKLLEEARLLNQRVEKARAVAVSRP